MSMCNALADVILLCFETVVKHYKFSPNKTEQALHQKAELPLKFRNNWYLFRMKKEGSTYEKLEKDH